MSATLISPSFSATIKMTIYWELNLGCCATLDPSSMFCCYFILLPCFAIVFIHLTGYRAALSESKSECEVFLTATKPAPSVMALNWQGSTSLSHSSQVCVNIRWVRRQAQALSECRSEIDGVWWITCLIGGMLGWGGVWGNDTHLVWIEIV